MSYLDILQQQKQQIMQQSQMAMDNIEKIIALHNAQNTPPAPAPAQEKPSEQDMNQMVVAAIQNYIVKNLGPMAQSISVEDQQWLTANLLQFPGFLNSKSGQECVALMIDAFKQHAEVKSE